MGHNYEGDRQMQNPLHELPHGSKSSKKRSIPRIIYILAVIIFGVVAPFSLIISLSLILFGYNLLFRPQILSAKNDKMKNNFKTNKLLPYIAYKHPYETKDDEFSVLDRSLN
jgi:hypothetical protein